VTPGPMTAQEHLLPPEQRLTELGASVSPLIARSTKHRNRYGLPVDDNRTKNKG
jgi:hypothetical protein